jgi:hypothetical protein
LGFFAVDFLVLALVFGMPYDARAAAFFLAAHDSNFTRTDLPH